MKQIRNILLGILMIMLPVSIFALTGEEIIRKADAMQTFETSASSGELRITDRFGTKVSTFEAWSKGADLSLIEFTSIAERGQKILRTADALYLYYPDAEELIRMQGSALRQGMLGSDVSYEDMTGDDDRLSQYEVTLLGEETVLGEQTYVLELIAKTRSVPYPKEKVWISKDHFILLKGEYYTKSGRLIKEVDVQELGVFEGRTFAVETRISDTMKTDSETFMVLKELAIDIPIDDELFSLEELSW